MITLLKEYTEFLEKNYILTTGCWFKKGSLSIERNHNAIIMEFLKTKVEE